MKKSLHLQDWVVPVMAAMLVAAIGWFSHRMIEKGMKIRLRQATEAILNADVAALRFWEELQKSIADMRAADPNVRRLAAQLVDLAGSDSSPREAILASTALSELRAELDRTLRHVGYESFTVVDSTGRVIASPSDSLIGDESLATHPFLGKVMAGETVISTPFLADRTSSDRDEGGGKRPAMFIAAPVRDPDQWVIAVLAFRIDPEKDFTAILQIGRFGETGETYAFNADGLLVSQIRFDEHLRQAGLIPDVPDARGILNVQIRDPGGNLLEGFKPNRPLQEMPLTLMAADAVAGGTGVNVKGYRDYRGVMVVGAWTWVPELGVGVATEVNVEEAFSALGIVRRAFWSLFGLLVLGAGVLFFNSGTMARLRRRAEQAEQLGQYHLEKKIGEGGMGKVYRAHHALLRRPTAVKVLTADRATPELLMRFEREVQFTSRLSHPNTIAIYDYGHTPDGTFYYAMEYLSGITIGRLGEEDGPQVGARVIYLLEQICGSLAEAHEAGLIHRDIKPANIVVGDRGGLCDFVKVLDFGLVRPLEQVGGMAVTNVKQLTGTPLYLSPELIQSPESVGIHSDLYQIGGVAYFLLTGQQVFPGKSIYEVCAHHLHTEPERPSARLGRAVSRDLEEIVLMCLKKVPGERPASATALASELRRCADAGKWTQTEAHAWWARWKQRHAGQPDVLSTSSDALADSGPPRVVVDLAERKEA